MALTDFVVERDCTLLDAVEAIEHNHSRCVVVVEGGKVAGVISEGDVLRALLRGVSVRAPLRDFANPGFKFMETRDIGRALQLMREHGIALIPVIDEEARLTDVVTLRDVLNSFKR